MILTGEQRKQIAKDVLFECRNIEIKQLEELIQNHEEEELIVEILDCGVNAQTLLDAMTSLSDFWLHDIEIEEEI